MLLLSLYEFDRWKSVWTLLLAEVGKVDSNGTSIVSVFWRVIMVSVRLYRVMLRGRR